VVVRASAGGHGVQRHCRRAGEAAGTRAGQRSTKKFMPNGGQRLSRSPSSPMIRLH